MGHQVAWRTRLSRERLVEVEATGCSVGLAFEVRDRCLVRSRERGGWAGGFRGLLRSLVFVGV